MHRALDAPAGWAWAEHWYRPVMLGLALVALGFAALVWQARYSAFAGAGAVAIDYLTFVDFGRALVADGTPYRAYQLAGPYAFHDPVLVASAATAPNFYPPVFSLACVPLAVLPAILWWAVPLGILGWCVASWRPAPWAWPLLALALCWPATPSVVIVGGTTMWVAAIVAAGLRWRWPAVLVLLKPSFAPLALAGVRDRRAWFLGVALALLSLPWAADYLAAMRNATGIEWWYSLVDLPLVGVPVLAWIARR